MGLGSTTRRPDDVTIVSSVEVVPLVDEGLGNSAYLVDLGDGRALVVDVSRDLRGVQAAAAKRGLTVAFAAGGSIWFDAPMPLDWQKRAAFHSLVAKLR